MRIITTTVAVIAAISLLTAAASGDVIFTASGINDLNGGQSSAGFVNADVDTIAVTTEIDFRGLQLISADTSNDNTQAFAIYEGNASSSFSITDSSGDEIAKVTGSAVEATLQRNNGFVTVDLEFMNLTFTPNAPSLQGITIQSANLGIDDFQSSLIALDLQSFSDGIESGVFSLDDADGNLRFNENSETTSLNIDFNNTNFSIEVAAVPEPTSALALMMLMMGIASTRHRRR